ncbi:MAG TPA: hypothetical protein EYP73_04045 [Acidimicrobiia bacterium]|nr:hypothetical protein [Acidimicrobiia bacterium]
MTKRTLALSGVLALLVASCGGPRAEVHDLTQPPADSAPTYHDASLVPSLGIEHSPSVQVVMTDFAFVPESSVFEVGETVTFVFRNMGVIPHDAVIGTEEQALEHAVEMAEMLEGGGDEDEAEEEEVPGIDLAPGRAGALIYTFTEPGQLVMACTWPGHLEAGMVIDIAVTE